MRLLKQWLTHFTQQIMPTVAVTHGHLLETQCSLRRPEFSGSFIKSHKLFPAPVGGIIMEKGIEINFQVAECTLGSEPKSCTMNGRVFPYSWKWTLSCFFCMVRGITPLLCHMAVGFVRASGCRSLPLVCHNLFLLPTAPLPSSQMVLFFSCLQLLL